MARRPYLVRGIYVTCGIVLLVVIAALSQLALSYDGTCGGFLPALAGPRPCSFWKYAFENLLLYAIFPGNTYWPAVLVLLLVPPIVGYVLDRRR